VRIVLGNERDVDRADVGIHRHVVFGVDDAPGALVAQRFLEERHSGAPDDAAEHLAVRRLGVEHGADTVDRGDARHAHDAEFGVDAHLDEHGAERMHRVLLAFGAGLHLRARLGCGTAITRDRRRDRLAGRRALRRNRADPAILDRHLCGIAPMNRRLRIGDREIDEFARIARPAACTAGETLAADCEPPAPGAFGKRESPSSKRICLTGRPIASAATCDITV